MSTKPGATMQPSASTVRAAGELPIRPTATTRPSRTPTSAVYAGSPEPSTTVPPRTSRSRSGMDTLLVPVFDAVDARGVGADDLSLSFVRKRLDALHELVDDTRVLGV